MLALLLTAVFIFLNGFFVAAEFALVKLRATQLDRLGRRPDAAARTVVSIFHRLDRYLSATQLGITLASLGLGWVGEPAIAHGLESVAVRVGVPVTPALHSVAFVVGFSALTAGHIIFGELVPKLLAIASAERVALVVGRPLRVFYGIAWLPLMAINAAASLVLRGLGFGPMDHAEGALSEEEILGLITRSFAKGRQSQPKRQLLERVMRFTERTVRQVMVPRPDVTSLDADAPVGESIARAKASGFTRYPVVEGGDLDKVLGYVNIKDVLLGPETPSSLRERPLLREVMLVPETQGLFELMREMQRAQAPLAVVVDEYGGVAGMVTLEDVLEEIVGEIRDEHDSEHEAPVLEERADGAVIAGGMVTLIDLKAKGVDLGVEDADTVGGAVIERLGRLAREGDVVGFARHDVKVESVRRRRVERVSIRSRRP